MGSSTSGKRRPRTFPIALTVPFSALPDDTRRDMAVCLMSRLDWHYETRRRDGLFSDDVFLLLTKLDPPVPILHVPTRVLTREPRETIEEVVLEYQDVWASGVATFPPVVIDSSTPEVLCEGGHRSFSAHAAGVDAIEAVDVATVDVEPFIKAFRLRPRSMR